MGEISGFGGSYEAACQDMLEAGMNWLMSRNDTDLTDLQGQTITNVFGIFTPNSDDAKALEEAVLAAVNNDCTGAMHHAVMSRLFWIAKNGWDAYCTIQRDRENMK